jgi:hypothetical protein
MNTNDECEEKVPAAPAPVCEECGGPIASGDRKLVREEGDHARELCGRCARGWNA